MWGQEGSRKLSKRLDQLLIEAIDLLAADRPLPHWYFDHPLSGERLPRLSHQAGFGLDLREAGRAYATPGAPRLA